MNSKVETDDAVKKKQKAQYSDVTSIQTRQCNYSEHFLPLLKCSNALLNCFLRMLSDNITYHHIFVLPHSVCDQQDTCTHKNLLYSCSFLPGRLQE